MIKIFNATDTDFNTAGNIIINPLYCHEVKKKSLNGWYIDVEIPIKYKEYIKADKLCVVKTKSKLNPQAFRINKNIKYTTKKIKFTAEHVMFDSKKYALLDVRPTDLNGLNGLKYINERTDKTSPFSIVSSDVENINTVYLVRKNLLEAWEIFEERWGGVFDADNWNISFKQKVGNDNGETIAYGKNMQGFEILEDWSNVCTKILPVGPNGLLLKEVYLESEVQYEVPYTKIVEFQTKLESEKQTEANLLNELKNNAEEYLEEYCIPQVSYTVESNINQKLEIGDTIKVLHPSVKIFTEVLEYEYDLISEKVKSLTFGNYKRDVKAKFDSIKNNIETIKQSVSNQEITIKEQTDLINSLNKKGYVYIDENEILILDQLPKEKAKNVWRFGLGGIGFSSNGYEGPFETAITMDGKINADFIKAGTMSTARIESLADFISDTNESISTIQLQQENITSEVSKKVNETELGTKIVQNFENVKIAWNKITEFIQMMILNGNASLAILDNSKKILMSLDKAGQHFYDSSENKIGDVGVINYKNTPMIAFNLNVSQNNNKGMAWGIEKNGTFYPIFYTVGTYYEEQSEYGGEFAIVGTLTTPGINITNGTITTEELQINLTTKDGTFLGYFGQKGFALGDLIEGGLNVEGGYSIDFKNNSIINVDNMATSDNVSAFSAGSSGSDYLHVGKRDNTGFNLWASSSDINLKKNVKDTEVNAIETIKKIKHKQFDWKKDNKHQKVGYIAQEMQKIDENFVHYIKTGEKEDWQINVLSVLATATKAIQEQQEQIEQLKKENNLIQNLIKKIEKLENEQKG